MSEEKKEKMTYDEGTGVLAEINGPVITIKTFVCIPPSRAQLTTQRRNMLTMKADIEREIKKLQAQCATLEAGAQALEYQINQMIDKPTKQE